MKEPQGSQIRRKHIIRALVFPRDACEIQRLLGFVSLFKHHVTKLVQAKPRPQKYIKDYWLVENEAFVQLSGKAK